MDRIVFGGKINETKFKKMGLTCWNRMFGLPQTGGRGFGRIYHMRHGKTMDGFNISAVPKLLGFLFKRK